LRTAIGLRDVTPLRVTFFFGADTLRARAARAAALFDKALDRVRRDVDLTMNSRLSG
jgi:hypothetical protein